jgi:hypothetical protein
LGRETTFHVVALEICGSELLSHVLLAGSTGSVHELSVAELLQ